MVTQIIVGFMFAEITREQVWEENRGKKRGFASETVGTYCGAAEFSEFL